LPRIRATSASVLPVSGFSASFLKPTRIILSGAGAMSRVLPLLRPGVRISARDPGAHAGSFSARSTLEPPSWTQSGIAASSPVAPAV
jgi:hypothetical protein